MTAATRSLATALWGARFASGLLPLSYTTRRDTTYRSREKPRRDGGRRRPDSRGSPGASSDSLRGRRIRAMPGSGAITGRLLGAALNAGRYLLPKSRKACYGFRMARENVCGRT